MKFKNKIFACLLALLVIGDVSCKKYLDINTSPLTATKVDPKLLFGYAVTAWDVNKNSGDNYIALGFLGQNLANGGNFSDNWGAFNIYVLSPNFLSNTWNVYYSTAGNNFKQAIAIAESSIPKNNNAAAQCKITYAEMMYEATTLYGDIPYSQASQADQFPYPKYDAQKDVFESLLSLLDEANAQIDVNSPLKISDYDIFYSGDMNAWKRLANTIKFKILMTMVDKDPTKAAAIGTLISNPSTMMSSTADTWQVKYSGATNNENPKYRLFLGQNPFTYASKVATDLMVPSNDPRLPKYFDLPAGQTTYKGVAENAEADATTSLMSLYLYRKNAPSVIIGYPQIELLEAEAWARGLGVAANLVTAQTLYKKGVTDAMTFYEADPTAISTYVNDPVRFPLLTPTNALTLIHTQQWLDLLDRSLDAFTQWRRSGVDGSSEIPVLTLPKDATPGPLFRRYPYPVTETTANSNIPKPVPAYSDKMWFDL
ncbi:SusD-like starch-binding protein associating with outer membrane [Mucilaginibacter yixingensis]|uniref:SusD-like starch-binding protein associating with outer membrane n=1 Tax=Mucilaginibacter yixingensis TaxID=1295612 RepID=A0A2T5JDD9_9SPHI|nr:SusD/RagB family nutrient-binding outer membrane lipoprotein [Mucilaginibacter yixingensis]PTQ99779.1 SusD-like starch-binding protein associating with outer membrane [Mucilaginibacter yixingensis]